MSHLLSACPSAQLAESLRTPSGGTNGGRPSPSAFDTMETRFFKEGDELSGAPSDALPEAPPNGDVWDEPTVVVDRRRRKGGLLSWTAVATTVCVAGALLAFWKTRPQRQPPSPAVVQPASPVVQVASEPIPPPSIAPTTGEAIPVPAAFLPTLPAIPPPSEPSPPQAAAGAPTPEVDSSAFDACKQAFARHRGKDVLASCGRAFDENPRSASVAVMLAKTELDRGRFRPALNWAKKALALDDNQADAYVFLGGAEQAAGHAPAAKSAYQRYLQLAPKGRYAADLRAILSSL
jgi:hypothetical protein